MTDLRDAIRAIPDYPKPGIVFRDVTTLLADGPALGRAIDALVAAVDGERFDKVAGIEARGFILGGAVAHRLGLGFVPVRKKGKLPRETITESYELEYGVDEVEVHVDAVGEGERILLVDDLIATGGTAMAALKLIGRAGADAPVCAFVVDLPELGGAQRLRDLGKSVVALVDFEGA